MSSYDTTAQSPADTQAPPADKDLQKAELEIQLAQLRANAEYNNSPAGQLQRQFETYQRIAKPLSESEFVPESYKGNIGNCVIAVEMAARLGVFPLTVMQNLCIVKGNPTWKSKFLIGCVNTCGRYTSLDYRVTIDGPVGDVCYKTWPKGDDGKKHEVLVPFEHPDIDNLVCEAYAIEKATGRQLVSAPVSIRMAVQEGWYTKDGSKWPTMPLQMLRYRAASFWVSAFAPEMSMGFRTDDEARDIEDVDYQDISADTPASRHKPSSANIDDAKQKLRRRAEAKAAAISDPQTPSDNPPASQPRQFDMP